MNGNRILDRCCQWSKQHLRDKGTQILSCTGCSISLLFMMNLAVAACSVSPLTVSQAQSSERQTSPPSDRIDPELSEDNLPVPLSNNRQNERQTMPHPPGEEMTITGVIEPGVECPVIKKDDGKAIALSRLPNRAKYGDRITVTGILAGSASCQQLVLVVQD